MSKHAPLPEVNRDAIANAFELASRLIDDAESSLALDWDRNAMERCSALLAGAKAILDLERAKVLPMEDHEERKPRAALAKAGGAA